MWPKKRKASVAYKDLHFHGSWFDFPLSQPRVYVFYNGKKKNPSMPLFTKVWRGGGVHTSKKILTTTKSTPNVIDSLCTCLCIFSRLCIYKWEMYDSSFEMSIITRYFFLRLNVNPKMRFWLSLDHLLYKAAPFIFITFVIFSNNLFLLLHTIFYANLRKGEGLN